MAAASTTAERTQAVKDYVFSHVSNSDHWALPFFDVHLPGWLTLHGLMLIVAALILIALFGLAFRRNDRVPRGLAGALEAIVKFVRDNISIANLGEEDGRRMAPLFCSLFFFVLTLNLMGIVPLFATATGNLGVTTALALVTLGVMIGGAIYKNGLIGFAKAFVPAGIPIPVLIILAPIEFMGMFIKTFALTIRLFANMLAGHIVIFVLLGLVVIFGGIALPSVVLAIGIDLLEVLIAPLQAYIFTLLSAMFIAQIHHPEH
ncbi:MAG: F0F1 ATP synthase subunit A [Kiritimatiellae bacterium]|nr:F0F1 ATP synthase subunit A [Kiritimatiellia bacterium]